MVEVRMNWLGLVRLLFDEDLSHPSSSLIMLISQLLVASPPIAPPSSSSICYLANCLFTEEAQKLLG